MKYSFLASFTKLVSQLNTSEQLCLSALFQGGTSCCLELGALLRLPWMWSHPEACCPQGLGKDAAFWTWRTAQALAHEELLGQMVVPLGRLLVIR